MMTQKKLFISIISLAVMLLSGHTAQAQNISSIVQRIKALTPMSVSTSYKAIPHAQTTYNMSQSSLPAAEKKYFNDLFILTDLMMSARVSTLSHLYHGRGGMSVKQYNVAYHLAMQGFAALNVPANAKLSHNLIATAITEHKQFLNKWGSASPQEKKRIKNNYIKDGLVSSSSSRLIGAHGGLIASYGSETPYNKKAFYDHLCALDFK